MKFVIVLLIIQNSFFAQDSLIDKKDVKLDTSKIPKFDFKPKLDFSKAMNFNIKDVLPDLQDKGLKFTGKQISDKKVIAKSFIPIPPEKDDIIIMKTNYGQIKLEYFVDQAPKHCENFKKLANSGFYDSTRFHRVIKDFMIQGGDILSRDDDKKNDGQGDPGWKIDAEFNSINHVPGILSMARGPGDPNSAGSQFFICTSNAPHLDNKYTAFGKVIEGMEVVREIEKQITDRILIENVLHVSIPKSENPKDWIRIADNRLRRIVYVKVPDGKDANLHKSEIKSKMSSDNPIYPVLINQLRVVSNVNNK